MSVPRRRESIYAAALLDPRLRGGDRGRRAFILLEALNFVKAPPAFVMLSEGSGQRMERDPNRDESRLGPEPAPVLVLGPDPSLRSEPALSAAEGMTESAHVPPREFSRTHSASTTGRPVNCDNSFRTQELRALRIKD